MIAYWSRTRRKQEENKKKTRRKSGENKKKIRRKPGELGENNGTG